MKHLLATFLAVVVGAFNCASAAEPPAPADSTITFFYYKDLTPIALFYEETLGLEKTLDMGWVKIYRVSPTSSVGITEEGRGFHKTAPNKPAMLSIVTGDVDAWYERVKEAATPIRSDLPPQNDMPAPHDAPIRGFIMEDPGGYTIEVFSWRQED